MGAFEGRDAFLAEVILLPACLNFTSAKSAKSLLTRVEMRREDR